MLHDTARDDFYRRAVCSVQSDGSFHLQGGPSGGWKGVRCSSRRSQSQVKEGARSLPWHAAAASGFNALLSHSRHAGEEISEPGMATLIS